MIVLTFLQLPRDLLIHPQTNLKLLQGQGWVGAELRVNNIYNITMILIFNLISL